MGYIKFAMLSLCLLFAPFVHAEDASKEAADFVYQTKPGDTLSKLAKTLLDKPRRWQDVAAYNKLPDADQIGIGQTLRIKMIWLNERPQPAPIAKVAVESVSGAAKSDGKLVKAGDELLAGAKLESAGGTVLRLRLPDGSIVNMQERTVLELEKLEQLPAGSFKALLRLVTGQIDAFKKKYPQGQADLAVRAVTATIGVRGTHFRMRQAGGNSFAEIEEGVVSFEADKTPQVLSLAGGYGSVANGKDAAEVIALLPAPIFPQLPAAFETPYVEWTMPDMPGAQAYVGELAQDGQFSRNVKFIQAQEKSISLPELSNGTYWLRLRAVDGHGLQGMEGKVSFTVDVHPRIMALIKAYIGSDSIQLRWIGHGENASYQVQVADNQQFNTPLLDTETTELSAEMPKPAGGRYFVRVRGISSDRHADQWDAPVMFVVR